MRGGSGDADYRLGEFFKELAGKDNAIYNNLPDSTMIFLLAITYWFLLLVISHLSNRWPRRRLGRGEIREHFQVHFHLHQKSMSFLTLIATRSLIIQHVGETSWKYHREALSTFQANGGSQTVAFCLSLLPFKSERSVKKLIEGLQFYRDELHEPKGIREVYRNLTEGTYRPKNFTWRL